MVHQTKKIVRRSVAENSTQVLPHLLHRIYSGRGIKCLSEMERGLNHLLPYENLLGINEAVTLLAESIYAQKNILIVGDFDADGATSTALAMRALKSLGAAHVSYLVPNRFHFGYGLSKELVDVAYKLAPYLIVTVDNGIANHEGVFHAKKLGIKVIITDHHLPSETLPNADAIVNPNQPNDPFLSKNLAGVGVIFYVMLALRRFLREQNYFNKLAIKEPSFAPLLELVALGTVADMVPLDKNNRILVYQGLQRIRTQQRIVGISALLELNSRPFTKLSASDLGFMIAPRLNAAGRLDDMSLGIECLLTDDLHKARKIAHLLNQLNDERKVIEHTMQKEALSILKNIHVKETNLPIGICLYDATWHQGVIGIVAGRLKERFHRPVIVFAMANEKELKGSARSIAQLHIRDLLADMAVSWPNLIKKFGGHAMAAGLVIDKDVFSLFAQKFNELVTKKLTKEQLENILLTDGSLSTSELSLANAKLLYTAGPFGQAFPEPLFDDIFHVASQYIVGEKHLKLKLHKEDFFFDAIAFNINLALWPNHRCTKVHVAYKVDINEFQGRQTIQLIVEHLAEAL